MLIVCRYIRALGASRFYRVQTKQTDKVVTTTKCNSNRGSRVCMMNQQPTGPVAFKFSHTFIKTKLLLNIITNFIVSILVAVVVVVAISVARKLSPQFA